MADERLGTHRHTVRSLERTSGGRGGRTYRYARPWISLAAEWLRGAGFDEGDAIDVHAYRGVLVIVRAGTATATDELIEKRGGYWAGECPDHPVADWQDDVAHGDTRQGYWEWARAARGDARR